MKRVGLTGGIGSGKSFIAEIFRNLGVPVFNSDDAARKIQQTDTEVQSAIRESFGDVFLDTGELDRKKLASIVFADQQKLAQLNAIVHPAVGKAFERFCSENSSAAYVIKEAAIIFEIGLDEELDGTILVTAPEHIRIERVIKRDNISETEVRSRMSKQWTDQEKMQRADWMINNDGAVPLLPQVLRIHDSLTSL
jgi:dephospho-CoA kinase